MKEKGGFRLNEILGTEPSVYYLPPVKRLFPFQDVKITESNEHQKEGKASN